MRTVFSDDSTTADSTNVLPFQLLNQVNPLPANCGPIIFTQILERDEGLRIKAETDSDSGHSLSITRVNSDGEVLYGDGSEGGIEIFEHHSRILQTEHIFGFLTYTTNVELDEEGVSILMTCALPNFFSGEVILNHKIPWEN